MTDVDGTCEYVLDPDDPKTWGGEADEDSQVEEQILNEEGVWSCPHNAEDGKALCIFHLPVEDKDDHEVVSRFLESVGAPKEGRASSNSQFIGGRFGSFELEDEKIATEENGSSIRLSHATFANIRLEDVDIGSDVYLRRIDVDNSSFFRETRFGGFVDFTRAELWGETDFRGCRFDDCTVFDRTAFGDQADFSDSVFGEAEFRRAAFGDNCLFQGTTFDQNANFVRTKVHGGSVFKQGEFSRRVDFREAEFEGKTDFSLCDFNGDTNFEQAHFCGETKFSEGQFHGESSFDSATFERRTLFWDSTFRKDVKFAAAVFEGYVDFSRAEFKRAAHFSDITCNANERGRQDVVFRDTEFDENVWFGNAVFRGTTNFHNSAFHGISFFRGAEFEDEVDFLFSNFYNTNFSTVTFEDKARFAETTFVGEASFSGVEFEGSVDFKLAEFNAGPQFADVDLTDSVFARADITDAEFSGAALCRADFEAALLSRATLFGADLRGAKLSGAVLGDIRMDDDTRFLGQPLGDSDTSPHTVSAIRSRPTCVYDPRYKNGNGHEDVDKAKSVYRALEELGRKHARPRLQARSFVRRQDLQKDEYKQDTKQADSWEERLIAGARYSRAKVARATLLYGESPWRVIAYSLSIILGFALLFPLGGWIKPEGGDPITYAQIASNPVEILNSVYYSTLTFTALGFGDFKPVGLGRALTTIETGLGAVLLALLVFILGRRAAR
jgi:uncharacterized protein YjbI with pentapeptide repeats